jgi:hypothetical protein
MMRKLGGAVALWLAMSGPLFAQSQNGMTGATPAPDECGAPPTMPSMTRPQNPPVKPQLPPCINPQTRISTCSAKVRERANASVRAYNQGLATFNVAAGQFVDAYNLWGRTTVQYANCEITALNNETPGQ